MLGPTAAGLIQKAVQDSLESFQYENAIFFAQRLVASQGSDENTCSLANCYYRAGQVHPPFGGGGGGGVGAECARAGGRAGGHVASGGRGACVCRGALVMTDSLTVQRAGQTGVQHPERPPV